MIWQALLILYDTITETSKWIIQTHDNKLYPLTIKTNDSRTEIAERIATINNIPLNRVVFHDEKRRRDKHTIYRYVVMGDDLPPF